MSTTLAYHLTLKLTLRDGPLMIVNLFVCRFQMGDILKSKIQRRPDRQELIQQHILEGENRISVEVIKLTSDLGESSLRTGS